MAYIIKPDTKLTIDSSQKIWGVNNHLPIRNIDSAAGDIVLPTQQGGIVDVIRDKAEDVLRDKLGDDLPSDNPYVPTYSDGSSSSSTDISQGTQTDSTSVEDPAQTIDDLNQMLNNLGSNLTDWETFYKLLSTIFQRAHAGNVFTSDAARLEIAEKIATMVYNFTASVYSNAFQSQLWYEQQYYNSPAMQLKRLADAGLLGMWSQINTGNASSAANSSPVSEVGQSNAAAIDQQAKQARMENILNGVGLSMQFASLAVEGAKAATEMGVNKAQATVLTEQAKTIHQMRPEQVRNLILENDVLDKTINEKLPAEIDLLKAQKIASETQVNFMNEQMLQAWVNLIQTYDMFTQKLNLDQYLGELNAATQVKTATIGANASMYGANKAFESSVLGVLGNFTYEYEEEGFREVDASGSLTGAYHSGVDLGIKAGVEVGGTVSIGGKTYKKERYKRTVPAAQFMKEMLDWCGSRNSDNYTFHDGAKNMTKYLRFTRLFSSKLAEALSKGLSDTIKPQVPNVPSSVPQY